MLFLDIIPPEVLVRALHNCDYITIIRFSLTCKKAYNVVNSSVSLQLHIELDINGLEITNGSQVNPSYSLVLKELREYQDAWDNFRVGSRIQQPVGAIDLDVATWELRSGTYCGYLRIPRPNFNKDHRSRAMQAQVAALGSLTIPPLTNYEKKYEFCLTDPKQDLAVLIGDEQSSSTFARFYLRSATTGQPHQLAAHSILTISFDETFLQKNDLLEASISSNALVVGNYLGVIICWPDSGCNVSEIILYDWKAGFLLARIYSENKTDCFTFLDQDHLLVYATLPKNDLQPAHLALLIYRIPKATTDNGIQPDAYFQVSVYPKHHPILIFELPEPHPSYTFTKTDIMLYSDPLPGEVVYAKSANFMCSRATTLCLNFKIHDNTDQEPEGSGPDGREPTLVRVVVNTNSLFGRVLERRSKGTTIVPWSQWGTPATRWFVQNKSTGPLVFELNRSQCLKLSIEPDRSQLLTIVDFNPPVVRKHAYTPAVTSQTSSTPNDVLEIAVREGRGLNLGHVPQLTESSPGLPTTGTPNYDIHIQTVGSEMETVIEDGFKDPVISRLPYRMVTKLQTMPFHSAWLIHGEWLVGVPRRGWPEARNPPLSLYKLEILSSD